MTTAKRIHLWENGTWDDLGGHWIAVRREEWEEMLEIIASASSLERADRLGTTTAGKWCLMRKRLKAYRDGLAQAELFNLHQREKT